MSSGVQPKQVVSSVQASREAIAEATKLKGYKVSTSLLAGLKKQVRGFLSSFGLINMLASVQARAVAWNHTGDRVAVASDMTVYIFPSPHQKGRPVRCRAVPRDPNVCLSALQGMKELQLTGHANAVNDLTWHPADPTILTSVSSDKTIRFWNVTSTSNISVFWFLPVLTDPSRQGVPGVLNPLGEARRRQGAYSESGFLESRCFNHSYLR